MTTDRKCSSCGAFTLVEVMIIVALIGLLAVLAMPSFIKVRKQTQGKRIVNDARIIDTAIDAWAIEDNKADGDAVDMARISRYAKSGNIDPNDIMGNLYGIDPVGTNQVRICTVSKAALNGVTIDWGSY